MASSARATVGVLRSAASRQHDHVIEHSEQQTANGQLDDKKVSCPVLPFLIESDTLMAAMSCRQSATVLTVFAISIRFPANQCWKVLGMVSRARMRHFSPEKKYGHRYCWDHSTLISHPRYGAVFDTPDVSIDSPSTMS